MPATVVVGVGVAGWDGGTDLFLDVARRLMDDPDVQFRWIGRRPRGAARWLDLDAGLLGVTDRVSWVDGPESVGPQVAVVPARSADGRDRAIEQLGGGVPVVGFAHRGDDRLPARPEVDLVDFPDTVALAARVRAVLDGRDRSR